MEYKEMARQVVRFHARPLIDVLRRIYNTGIKLPSFTVGEVRVSFDPLLGRLFATYANERIGTVKTSGLFEPAPRSRLVSHKLLRDIVEHPLEAAVAGLILGPRARCAICRIPLGREDRPRGIGASCWEKGEFWRLEKKTNVGDRSSSKIGTRRKVRR
jgi:hypothetical protein